MAPGDPLRRRSERAIRMVWLLGVMSGCARDEHDAAPPPPPAEPCPLLPPPAAARHMAQGAAPGTVEKEGGGVPVGPMPAYTVKVGPAPLLVESGRKVGYALTAAAPKSYELRWTGNTRVVSRGGYREFHGWVWTTGHFKSVTPGCAGECPLESGDFVSQVEEVPRGERIYWHAFASDGWDGFDFTTDSESVVLDVFVDGERSTRVDFPSGAKGDLANPESGPFRVTSAK